MADLAQIEEIARARASVLYGMGLDNKRPDAWTQYGWPEALSVDSLRRAYERGGPGHGAVHRLLDKCWQEWPRIKSPEADEESPWETTLGKLLDGINAWQKLRDFDRRNMVGEYAGLIYRVADGQALSTPLAAAKRLVDLVPVYQDQLRVTAWHNDPADPDNFGSPKMFQYRRRVLSQKDTQGQPADWDDVHPSRVQLLAEGSVGDFLDGVPLLKAGYNHLVDLEKIGGGSAEGFLKNSARTVVFEYLPDSTPQDLRLPDGSIKSVRQQHEEQARALNRNQDSSIVMQGGKAATLQTTASDPTGAWILAASLFAASVQIPMTVIFGQQTGRLASDEDKADMVARCKSRQRNELTPMLREFVTRMQACGVIEAGEFEIEWAPLDVPGDKERLELVGMMADVNLKAFQAGDRPVFNTNEQRKAAAYEELPDGEEMLLPEEKAAADAALQTEMAKEAAKLQPKQPANQPANQPGQQPPTKKAGAP